MFERGARAPHVRRIGHQDHPGPALRMCQPRDIDRTLPGVRRSIVHDEYPLQERRALRVDGPMPEGRRLPRYSLADGPSRRWRVRDRTGSRRAAASARRRPDSFNSPATVAHAERTTMASARVGASLGGNNG